MTSDRVKSFFNGWRFADFVLLAAVIGGAFVWKYRLEQVEMLVAREAAALERHIEEYDDHVKESIGSRTEWRSDMNETHRRLDRIERRLGLE